MLQEANVTRYFKYQKEEAQNPYIGFCSFQHFRGEKLYSDRIVRPENNLCETEDVECYPVPQWVPENGRNEGWYPDTSIVYIRILWKEFEPERGVYNYRFVEDILDKARAHGQTAAFRLMAHSTRDIEDVPEWLKAMIPCPERPQGQRVKDSPTDPLFLKLFGDAVRAFGERFDSDPTLDTFDISLPGAWGEGHKLNLYPEEDVQRLYDIHSEVFKHTRLVGQLEKAYLAKKISSTVPIGLRGDGLGTPVYLYDRYDRYLSEFEDAWKRAPISFESYWWIGEWMRQGWDIDDIIQITLGWHISSFNAKSLPIPYEWKEKIEYWLSRMGYHYTIDYFKCPDTATAGDEIVLKLGIENIGVAPIYRSIPLHIRLRNGTDIYELDNDIDITRWLPGKIAHKLDLVLPDTIKAGAYDIEIGLFNEHIPVIYFCTDAPRNGSYYTLGKIQIN